MLRLVFSHTHNCYKPHSMGVKTIAVYFLTFWIGCFNFGLWDLENGFVVTTIYLCCFYYYLPCYVEASVCVPRGKKCSFSENLACFVFLKHPFWDSSVYHITFVLNVCVSHGYSCVMLFTGVIYSWSRFQNQFSFIKIVISHCQPR